MDDALRELVAFVARALVDAPDAIRVDSREDGGALVLELRVAPSDLGKVIGRAGNTARAVRAVLGAAAARAGRRAVLNIVED